MAVLVIDVGSSSARALLFDDQAAPIPGAAVSQPHQMTTVPPGAAVFDAGELRARVEACIDAILTHPAAGQIRVVALTTFVGNMLGVDAVGEAVTPVYTYADTRSVEDVEALKALLDVEAAHQRTGCLMHTAYQPGRLLWLRRTEPELFARAARWVDFGTYLYSHWFGESPCSYSVASWSGMLDRAGLCWDQVMLDAVGMDDSQFPALADRDAFQRGLTADYAARWLRLRDVPFCLAVGDGAAANIGSGCVDESRLALTVGTTAAMRVVTNAALPPVPPGLWSYRVDRNRHLVGGATSEGGSIFTWARETLRLGDVDVEAELARRPADSHGLTALPLLAGERSPGWIASATGALAGLRLSTTPLDVLQAMLESVALRLALIAHQLEPLAGAGLPVVAGGGAITGSRAWAGMIASALNRPLHVTEETEITACGAALLALNALDGLPLDAHPPAIAYTVEPDPAAVVALRVAGERQAALYDRLIRQPIV